MKRILVILADGFEEVEALVPIDVLRRVNYQVVIAGLDKKEITSTHNIALLCDDILDNQKNGLFDCIILPGGMPGTLNLKNSETVRNIILKHHNQNKLIGAICAAPSILEELGLLKGKHATSYPSFLNDENTIILEDRVVIDENIITSRGAGTAFDFAYKILETLGGNAKELKNTMMYQEDK